MLQARGIQGRSTRAASRRTPSSCSRIPPHVSPDLFLDFRAKYRLSLGPTGHLLWFRYFCRLTNCNNLSLIEHGASAASLNCAWSSCAYPAFFLNHVSHPRRAMKLSTSQLIFSPNSCSCSRDRQTQERWRRCSSASNAVFIANASARLAPAQKQSKSEETSKKLQRKSSPFDFHYEATKVDL